MKLIGLDVGTKRIGVARADSSTRIAVPETTVEVKDGAEFDEIAKIAKKYSSTWFVVGLPRNNEGKETAQSEYAKNFAKILSKKIPGAKIRFQDESLTSVEAESRLMKKVNKTGKLYQKGDVDTEAATIILQDFLEGFKAPAVKTAKAAAKSETGAAKSEKALAVPNTSNRNFLDQKETKAMKKTKARNKTILRVSLSVVGALVVLVAGFFIWYHASLSPVYDTRLCNTSSSEDDENCKLVEFTIDEGDGVQQIGDALRSAKLIKSSLAFRLYLTLNHNSDPLKAGVYKLSKTSSVADIVAQLLDGAENPNVFQITFLPGETVRDVKKKLVSVGYSSAEVDAAFSKFYDHPVFSGKEDTSAWGAEPLEGYIFGDTYEFYRDESVENIILTTLDNLWAAIEGNNLVAKFGEHSLSLYEGITLASIVQKEASTMDQPAVAQVFYNRLEAGIAFGSDVTLTYALNLVDPDRTTYQYNADALTLDHPYNTRNAVYTGLTPGPIANPGISALLAVASPAEPEGFSDDHKAYYFLTGDDGKMYYSNTEEGHIQNIVNYCQELCNVSL